MLRCQFLLIAFALFLGFDAGIAPFADAQDAFPAGETLITEDLFQEGISLAPSNRPGPIGQVGQLEIQPYEIGPNLSGNRVLQAESAVTATGGQVVSIDASKLEPEEQVIFFGDWLGYNPTQHDTTWVTGNGDRLGIFSLESFPALAVGKNSSLMLGTGVHFVNGPTATDLPPRLFDLLLAHQSRKAYGERLILDTKVGVGAFTDFEGSVRKGIRFPGHAVGYYQWHPWLVSVLGIEFLDRDDVSVLPVAGVVWRPKDDIVAELVFPRPRLQVRTGKNSAMYINGELGGGTWAIERADSTNDNATYRDIRIMLGGMRFGEENDSESALEIGWAFARALEYRSAGGNYHPDDTLIFRFRKHF